MRMQTKQNIQDAHCTMQQFSVFLLLQHSPAVTLEGDCTGDIFLFACDLSSHSEGSRNPS